MQRAEQLFTREEDNKQSFSHICFFFFFVRIDIRIVVSLFTVIDQQDPSCSCMYLLVVFVSYQMCIRVMTFGVCAWCFRSLLSTENVKARANQTESREQLVICQVFHKQTCIYLLTRFTLEVNLPFEQQEITIKIVAVYNHLFLLNIFDAVTRLAYLSCQDFIYDTPCHHNKVI